jgi:hypothetical protein
MINTGLPQTEEEKQRALAGSSPPMMGQPSSMTGLQQQQPPPISGPSGGALGGQPPVPANAPGGPDPAQAPAQGGPDLTKDMGTPDKVIQNKFSSHPNELADAQEAIAQRMDKARKDPVAKAQAQKMTMTMAEQGADPVKAADQLFGENGLAYIQIDREVEDWERANKGRRKKAIPSNNGPLSDAELNNLTADTGEAGGVSDSAPALSSEQAPPALDGEGQNVVPQEPDEPRNKSWGKRIKARLRNVYKHIPEDEMGLFLMEFGMRAMMAGETMGTMGALGAAGSGAMSSLQGRQTAAADRKLEADKYADEKAYKDKEMSLAEQEAALKGPDTLETAEGIKIWNGQGWEWMIDEATGERVMPSEGSDGYKGMWDWATNLANEKNIPGLGADDMIKAMAGADTELEEKQAIKKRITDALMDYKELLRKDPTGGLLRQAGLSEDEKYTWTDSTGATVTKALKDMREGDLEDYANSEWEVVKERRDAYQKRRDVYERTRAGQAAATKPALQE